MLCLRCRIASRGRIEIQLSAWSATCGTAPTAGNGVVVHLHCYSTQVPAFTVRVYRMYCSRARQRSEIHRNTTPASLSPGSCSVILWLMCDHSLSVHTQSMLRGNTVADLAGSCPEASATPVHISEPTNVSNYPAIRQDPKVIQSGYLHKEVLLPPPPPPPSEHPEEYTVSSGCVCMTR